MSIPKAIAVVGAPIYLNPTTFPTIEDPISEGGTISNNTQGVGGNIAPLDWTSIKVALAADGATNIAQGTQQTPYTEYDDSFGIWPGYTGNQRGTGIVYQFSGYTGGINHEIGILLKASTTANNISWYELLWSQAGNMDILKLVGPRGTFVSIANGGSGIGRGPLMDDIFVGEYNDTTKAIAIKINGTTYLTYDGSNGAHNLAGTGIGMNIFLRASTDRTKLGFKSFKRETF